jgi:hypothetical protein
MTVQTDIAQLSADTETAIKNAQAVVGNLIELAAALQSTAALVTEGSAPVAAAPTTAAAQ